MGLESVQSKIKESKNTWLVTGAAGFIGSHLVEKLLHLNQNVVAIDNFSTGSRDNLLAVEKSVGREKYSDHFKFFEGDISDYETCETICNGVDYVLHQAAVCSVPWSLENPLETHDSNVTGTVVLMWACVKAKVKRFVYASSSSVYGNQPAMPNREEQVDAQLSPYAAGKYICELYAKNFFNAYQLQTIGLRYFNVFGPRQSVEGSYAAVIPCFVKEILKNRPVKIFGDGTTSRDYCFIENAVQANLLSALTESKNCYGKSFNVSCGVETSLLELYAIIKHYFKKKYPELEIYQPVHHDFRPGDVQHSLADISQITTNMGYRPTHLIDEGMQITLDWFLKS